MPESVQRAGTAFAETDQSPSMVVHYGVSIVEVAEAVPDNVIDNLERMTGLEVTEVNVSVDDVWMGELEETESRVQ
jgi:uncharacterized alkaline shock family protein YloU